MADAGLQIDTGEPMAVVHCLRGYFLHLYAALETSMSAIVIFDEQTMNFINFKGKSFSRVSDILGFFKKMSKLKFTDDERRCCKDVCRLIAKYISMRNFLAHSMVSLNGDKLKLVKVHIDIKKTENDEDYEELSLDHIEYSLNDLNAAVEELQRAWRMFKPIASRMRSLQG